MTTRQPQMSPPPALTLDPQKATSDMRESLQDLRDSLLCPLCNQLLVEPTTLTCAHTFCLACIEEYTCDAWNCPVRSCGMPVSVRGGREGHGSYLAINPQLRTIVSSLGAISQTLNNAPNEWWKTPMPESMEEEEEEQVDLQANDEEQVDLQAAAKQDEVPVASSNAPQSPQTREDEAASSMKDVSPKAKSETPLNQKPNTGMETQLSMRSEGEDSQLTVKFSMQDPPSSSTDSPNLLDPIVEERDTTAESSRGAVNRSCLLPSQSPGFSPIAAMPSQPHDSPNSNSDKPISSVNLSQVPKDSAQEIRKMSKRTCNRKPRVLVASSLSSADHTIVRECMKRNRLELLLDSLDDHVDVEDDVDISEFISRLQDAPDVTYAVCGNAELETGDGFLVGRSFDYLLSVACGLPLVYMDYLQEANKKNESGFLFGPKGGKNQVIGDVKATTWMAPQRALESRIEGGVGTSLLEGYTILLHGDFDKVPSQKSRLGAGRKRSRTGGAASTPDTSKLYSWGRMKCLLQLCGARVYDLQNLVNENRSKSGNTVGSEFIVSGSGKAAILLRPDPHARDWRSAQKVIADCQFLQTLDPVPAIVRGDWLLDTIAEFEVKDFAEYMQMAAKRSGK